MPVFQKASDLKNNRNKGIKSPTRIKIDLNILAEQLLQKLLIQKVKRSLFAFTANGAPCDDWCITRVNQGPEK